MDDDWPAIKRIQQGDESGLVELMTRHKEAVFRFIFRYTNNESDAAELTEETFYRVFKNAGKFRPKAKVSTWIFTIAANLSRDFLRRESKKQNHVSLDARSDQAGSSSLLEVTPSDVIDPKRESLSREAVSAIESAIHSLPHKLKFPFVFCVLEDHSYDECAAVMKTNRKAIENRIYRARQMLRSQLTKYHEML